MITKILNSTIKIKILKAISKLSDKEINASRLKDVAELKYIPSPEISFLSNVGLISARKEGKDLFVSNNKKGNAVVKHIIEIEKILSH